VPSKVGSKVAIVKLYKNQFKRGVLTHKIQKQDKSARIKIEGESKITDVEVKNLIKMV
jgi:hypothetical protein